MVRVINDVRRAKVARMIQKELGILFLTEIAPLFDNVFISVSTVDLANDCNVARVYLSLSLNDYKEALLKKIECNKSMIRRLLGQRVAGKMRKVPDLRFEVDDSVSKGARVTALIDQLGAMER